MQPLQQRRIHKKKKYAKLRPLRRTKAFFIPTTTAPPTSQIFSSYSPGTIPPSSPTSPSSSLYSSPTTSPSNSPLTLPSVSGYSIIPSSIRPSYSLHESLIKSSLPDYLENLRTYSLDAAHTFCKRVAASLLVIFHHIYHRELQPRADDVDDFLQNLLLRPFTPLSAFVNARKSELGPSTMLSRFDDLSTFVSWYCLQDIAR